MPFWFPAPFIIAITKLHFNGTLAGDSLMKGLLVGRVGSIQFASLWEIRGLEVNECRI
jgi:hypothetical protein